MKPLNTARLVIKRIVDDWRLMLSIFVGILVATTLVAGAPIYLRALERLAIDTAIARTADTTINFHIFAPNIPLSHPGIAESQQKLQAAVDDNITPIYRGQRRYLRSDTMVMGLPYLPLDRDGGRSFASRGYIQYMSNIEDNIRFVEGRMATDTVVTRPDGTVVVEVILGTPSLEPFPLLKLGDEVEITPFLAHPSRVKVVIVGFFEPIDPRSEFWRNNANTFLRPEPPQQVPEAVISVNPMEPPLPFFATQAALLDGVGVPFPGGLINSTWFLFVDKQGLKQWSIGEGREHIGNFEADIIQAFPGSVVLSGIRRIFEEYERRSLFTGIPLLLLLALMVVTVLYYLLMMVSYLVQSREADIARLKTRGINSWQVLRLYGAESLILTSVAVVAAPLLAAAIVAVSGKLPYFHNINNGAALPAKVEGSAFIVSLIVGFVCLLIYVMPGLLASRAGLITHRLRASRPPTTPVFQRYYLDVALIILGGLVFWELYSRGSFASGGLFTDVQVNETLLLAPVLFLAAVALVFMRFFPLLIRFVSGESPRLLDMFVIATVAALSVGLGLRETLDGDTLDWVPSALVAVAIGLAYFATKQTERPVTHLLGLAAQAGAVAGFILMEPLSDGGIFYPAKAAAIAIVPSQLLFLLLKSFMHRAPVWVSVGLWQMARNPLRYSWLILLLVLVTGLGVLATTVGGTLDRSYTDRINYQTAMDIRVANIPGDIEDDLIALKERYQTIQGVTSVSLGYRATGGIGGSGSSSQFQVLGLEADTFPYKAWYREDFSERPLLTLMRPLQGGTAQHVLTLPEGTTQVGVYVKPNQLLPNVFLWMALEDSLGAVSTVTLGPVGPGQWHVMRADIPARLRGTVRLLSVQLYEPAFGPSGTPGSILIDNVHAVVGPDSSEVVLDDFEGRIEWTPLITSLISEDTIAADTADVFEGSRSALFTFGKDTNSGVRGIYISPTGGPLPVVVSRSFSSFTGATPGSVLVVSVAGSLIPVAVTDVVEYFPSLDPGVGPFVVADMQNLLRNLRFLSPTSNPTPNEMFLSHSPGAHETVTTALAEGLGRVRPIVIYDREAQLEAIQLDPLISAGWKAMVIVTLFVIILTAGLGYTTYLLSFSGRSKAQMGSLQTLGISAKQLLGLLSMEHLVIALFGLGLGTWAGFEMSRIMVQSVAVTERGTQVIPPFVLLTNWGFMSVVYIVLAAIFCTAIWVLHRGVTHMDLQTVSRTEAA